MPRPSPTEPPNHGSDYAERHAPRRTTKTRRPTDSGMNPLQRNVTPKRKRPEQQHLPYNDASMPTGVRTRRRALSRYIPDGFGRRLGKVSAALFFIGLLFGGLIFGLWLFGGSRFFALRAIVLEGNNRVSFQEVEAVIKGVTQEGVWRARLKIVQEELKKNELIEEAEVTRVLPDKFHVVIKEREPFALARRGEKLVCVDRNGTMFGDASLLKGNAPPLVRGLVESGENIIEENRRRLTLYQQLLGDLDNAEPKLSTRIDEVIFDDELNLSLILKDSRIVVRIGQEDFRTRLNAALDVLDAIRRKDAQALQVLKIEDAERLLSSTNRVAYLNATIPKRVIVGLAE